MDTEEIIFSDEREVDLMQRIYEANRSFVEAESLDDVSCIEGDGTFSFSIAGIRFRVTADPEYIYTRYIYIESVDDGFKYVYKGSARYFLREFACDYIIRRVLDSPHEFGIGANVTKEMIDVEIDECIVIYFDVPGGAIVKPYIFETDGDKFRIGDLEINISDLYPELY